MAEIRRYTRQEELDREYTERLYNLYITNLEINTYYRLCPIERLSR